MAMRDQGLVNQVFDEQKLRALQGDMARRPRPLLDHRRQLVGELAARLARRQARGRARPQRQPDQRRRAARRAARARRRVPLDVGLGDHRRAALHAPGGRRSRTRWPTSMPRLEGAYSTVVMTKDRVVAFRDPPGLRPLSLGMLGDRYCVASETCAFDIIGAKFLRDVQPGEIVSLTERRAADADGRRGRAPRAAACSSTSTSRARTRGSTARCCRSRAARMGEILAREAPVEADLVIPVPDSGNPAARGFARATGLPQDDGLIKNRYVARTFIQPGQELRKHGLRMKFNPLPEVVGGKRARRRRRLDRARQHDAPDRRDAARRRARARCTCASPRRRSATRATTGSTCRRARR